MIPTITTDRLTLRPYQRADFPAYEAFFGSPRAQYMGGPIDQEKAWSFFCNDIASWALYGFGNLAIEVDGKFAGTCGVVQPPDFPEPECGWVIHDGFEGKGYAKEAGAALLAHTFATTDLTTIVSYIDPANAPSLAVAAAVGGVADPKAATPSGYTITVFRHFPKEAS